jgi:hypothetical protein
MLQFNPNWAHIAALALANFVLGWAWYSPLLFAKPWMKALKVSPDHSKGPEAMKGFPRLMAGAAATSVLLSLGSLVLVQSLGAVTAQQGFGIGLFVALVFVAAHASGSLFEGRPALVWAIGALHAAAVLGMDCAVHAAWR